jgi:hypothetical protein
MFQLKRDLVAKIQAGLPGSQGRLRGATEGRRDDPDSDARHDRRSVGAGVLSGIFPPAAPIALPLLGG